MGGICIYKPIGDRRSLSALWAETEHFSSLGAGIATRKETREYYEGNYEIRYFLYGRKVAKFDLAITKKKNDKSYHLSWHKEGKQILHGSGLIVDSQMAVAWGELDTEWEVVILNIDQHPGKTCR